MRRVLVAMVLCMMMVSMIRVTPGMANPNGISDEAFAFTEAEGAQRYAIKLLDEEGLQQVRSVRVPDVNGYTVPVITDRTGKHIAYIEAFDGLYGRALHLVSRSGRDDRVVATGRIMDAAWSQDGGSLAYVTYPDAEDKSNVWILGANGQPVTIGNVTDVTRVLGWSATRDVLYVTRAQKTGGFDAEMVSALDLDTGEAEDLFKSDLDNHKYSLGFRLVYPSDGEAVISFLVSSSLVGAADRENYLALGALDGTIVRELPVTTDRILQWAWSDDLSSVAFVVGNLGENKERTGVWVMNSDGTSARQLTRDINLSYELRKWDGTRLTMQSSKHGLAEVDSAKAVLPQSSSDISDLAVSPTATNHYAPYAHQVFDTPTVNSAGTPYPNGYALPGRGKNDGGKQDACGPASAVMVAGALGFLRSNSVRIPEQTNNGQTVPAHYNSFGWYIPSRFTSDLTSYDFSRWDYSSTNSQFGQGAHGAMVVPRVGSDITGIKNFMTNLSGTTRTATWNPANTDGQTWARNQLASGHLIIANVQYPGMGGHWVVLKGWDSENGYYIVNDSYGQFRQSPYSWGLYDGADAKYGWQTMGVKGMVAYW